MKIDVGTKYSLYSLNIARPRRIFTITKVTKRFVSIVDDCGVTGRVTTGSLAMDALRNKVVEIKDRKEAQTQT